jgi:hypothetical protein
VSAAPGFLAVALVVLGLLAGCGDDSGDETEPEPTRPVETADKLPPLPDGWHQFENPHAGLALQLPRGWRGRVEGTTTDIRSYDGLVVVRITVDRTTDAISRDPAESAQQTLASLNLYEERLEPSPPRPYKHRYEGYEVTAAGTSVDTEVAEEASLIVLQRDELATINVFIRANAKSGERTREVADEVVATIRTRGVGSPPRDPASQ